MESEECKTLCLLLDNEKVKWIAIKMKYFNDVRLLNLYKTGMGWVLPLFSKFPNKT